MPGCILNSSARVKVPAACRVLTIPSMASDLELLPPCIGCCIPVGGAACDLSAPTPLPVPAGLGFAFGCFLGCGSGGAWAEPNPSSSNACCTSCTASDLCLTRSEAVFEGGRSPESSSNTTFSCSASKPSSVMLRCFARASYHIARPWPAALPTSLSAPFSCA